MKKIKTVGLSGDTGANDFYIQLRKAGVENVLLLGTEEEDAKLCDLIIIVGGFDVNPELYGESVKSWCGAINRYQDRVDSFLVKFAISNNIPLLGVCRGHQFINAFLGGKLCQDIIRELHTFHPTTLHKFGIFGRWKSPSLAELFPHINTYHHQSVLIPGNGQEVILTTEDGVVESTRNKSGTIVTMQFHPEYMYYEGTNYFSKVAETGKLIWD